MKCVDCQNVEFYDGYLCPFKVGVYGIYDECNVIVNGKEGYKVDFWGTDEEYTDIQILDNKKENLFRDSLPNNE